MENNIYFAKVDSTKETIIPSKREEDGHKFRMHINFNEI